MTAVNLYSTDFPAVNVGVYLSHIFKTIGTILTGIYRCRFRALDCCVTPKITKCTNINNPSVRKLRMSGLYKFLTKSVRLI